MPTAAHIRSIKNATWKSAVLVVRMKVPNPAVSLPEMKCPFLYDRRGFFFYKKSFELYKLVNFS